MADDPGGRSGPGIPPASDAGPADHEPDSASGRASQEPGGIVRVTPAGLGLPEEGGEAACYAHLVCPECGGVVTEGHRPGCSEAPGERGVPG